MRSLAPHRPTPVVIPSYAEKGNTFRIQKKGQQQVSNQIFAAKGQEQYAQLVFFPAHRLSLRLLPLYAESVSLLRIGRDNNSSMRRRDTVCA